jgi:serine/threonine protein phosphatase PrpC
MDKPAKVIVLGKDHEARGETWFGAWEASNVAWGTSVGVTAKPNEDCLGVSVWGTEIVLAIADGHWGRDASEIAVSKAVDLLRADSRPSQDSETRARLFALFEQVNTELYEIASSAPGASASETTLIVCHVKEVPAGKYLYWASFGDSFLFLLRNGELKQLNTLNAFWLGYLSKLSENANTKSILMRFLANEARYAGVASGLETGIEKLDPGDVLFLCTDGLVGSDCEPEPSILAGIQEILNSGLPLASRVEQILAAALNRGETDNISCVVTSIL